jgi:hypothetical protein
MVEVIINNDGWCYEIFLVPVSTEKPSQHRSATRYINRQLPLKGRCRGDVGLV